MLPISYKNERIMIDPPSGWKYGFPKEWTGDTKHMLKSANYPSVDIEWASKHCRFWTEAVE